MTSCELLALVRHGRLVDAVDLAPCSTCLDAKQESTGRDQRRGDHLRGWGITLSISCGAKHRLLRRLVRKDTLFYDDCGQQLPYLGLLTPTSRKENLRFPCRTVRTSMRRGATR